MGLMHRLTNSNEELGCAKSKADLDYWLSVLATLSPDGKPSMAQDIEASRRSEVELFARTVLKLAEKYGVSTPVNKDLYDRIKSIESKFEKVI